MSRENERVKAGVRATSNELSFRLNRSLDAGLSSGTMLHSCTGEAALTVHNNPMTDANEYALGFYQL